MLWDNRDLEIVGAYRMARSRPTIEQQGDISSLYTHSLYKFSQAFDPILENGLELGRSFIQPRYWGRSSLDYLWQGIGAYLNRYPDIRYLFGPVSISHDYPDTAKQLLISFYTAYFGCENQMAVARHPYHSISEESCVKFIGNDYSREFKTLKLELSKMGRAVPTLFKQYSELCEPDGVKFLAFNVDADFADCVDGLIVVDVKKIIPRKRGRYLGR